MKELSGLLIGTLVLLLLLPVPVFAGDISGPAGSVPDPCISAISIIPVVTTTPQSLVRNPTVVVRTIVTQQANGILILESVPTGASVYVDGTLKGTTPLTIRTIVTGVHVVTFNMTGYVDYTTKVTVAAGAVARSVGTLVPVTTEAVTTTVSPSVSVTTRVTVTSGMGITTPPNTTIPVTVTQGTETTIPPVTTVPLPVTQITQLITGKQPGTCTRHYFGSGEMGTAPDGRINCTVLITTDDQIMTLSALEGTLVTDAGKKPVPEIRITPVTPAEIPSITGPVGSRWTGRAYHFLPDHASFDPPVLVSFTLSQDEWERSDPANLTIQETNETGPGWERLPLSVDPLTRTLSAPARHFSIIGLFSTSPAAETPVTQQSPVDMVRTATGSTVGSLPLSPLIPDKYAPLAAVAAGIAISLIGTLASGSTLLSRLWNKITSLIEKFLGSETTGLMNVTEIEKRGLRPAENLSAVLLGLSLREILVIVLSALGFAAAFLLQDRLELKLVTVIIFVGAGGFATILHDLAHKYCAYRCGCITEYQFWSLGTITMLLTAWLFGNAFAKPSRTLIRSGKTLLPEEAARIKLAGPLTSMGMAVVSLFLIPLGGLFVVTGSAGFSMNLLNCLFSLVPVKPNDGVEIFAWNKLVWAVIFLPLFAFYLYIYLSM
jgi:Zn-dependent protease